MRPRVLFAILAHSGWIHASVMNSALAVLSDERIDTELAIMQRSPVEYARNLIVRYAINGGFDWLISMDHDNACTKNPVDLLFMGKDIIFCPTPMMSETGLRMNAYIPDRTEMNGLVEVERVGSGCFVMSGKVLQAIPKPLYSFVWRDDGMLEMSEDMHFCEKAREAGFVPYIHCDYPCHHFHQVDLLQFVNKKTSL